MDIGKLFNGIAIIVDNEIEDKTSAIYKIKELIEAKNIPVAVFSEVPQLDVIPAFASASFVILDWDYTNKGRLEVEDQEIAKRCICACLHFYSKTAYCCNQQFKRSGALGRRKGKSNFCKAKDRCCFRRRSLYSYF